MEILTKTDIRTLFESQQRKALRLKKSTAAENVHWHCIIRTGQKSHSASY